MSPHELLWYAENIRLDEKEEFEKERDIAEYGAMFFNPDGVKSVRDGRVDSNDYEEEFNPDEEFEKIRENPLVQKIKERYAASKDQEESPLSGNKITNAMNIT